LHYKNRLFVTGSADGVLDMWSMVAHIGPHSLMLSSDLTYSAGSKVINKYIMTTMLPVYTADVY